MRLFKFLGYTGHSDSLAHSSSIANNALPRVNGAALDLRGEVCRVSVKGHVGLNNQSSPKIDNSPHAMFLGGVCEGIGAGLTLSHVSWALFRTELNGKIGGM